MLRISVLGSGSSGNSAVVCLGDSTRILIDAGLSAKQLCLRMESVGVDPDSLTGIVLTHEHGDHSCGLDVFLRKREIPIFATRDTCQVVSEKLKSKAQWRIFEAGAAFQLGDATVESFSVPHDACDPVGYVIRGKKSTLGVLSDVGHVTQMIIDRLRGVDTLFTEANYDEVMLQNDTKRPWSTKQRISNRHGHLSNHQTADLISQIATEKLHRVLLGHLSSDCNTPELAGKIIQDRLVKEGFQDVAVECAHPKLPTAMHVACPETVEAHHEAIYPPVSENEVQPESEDSIVKDDPDSGVYAPILPRKPQQPEPVDNWTQTELAF